MNQSYYMDKDGNLIHTRSGEMIKRRIVINKFTGEGELVFVRHEDSELKEKKKKIKQDSELELLRHLQNSLRNLELDITMTMARFENPITDKKLELLIKNLRTLKSNITTVKTFVLKVREKKKNA